MDKKDTYISDCGICGKPIIDYPSNRKPTSSGKHYCSAKCRVISTMRQIEPKEESLCVTCREVKPAGQFYSDKKCKKNGGLQYSCKACVKVQRMAHYDANSERVIARVRKYASSHPDVTRRHSRTQRAKSTKLQRAARRALNAAVHRGKIARPSSCEKCGKCCSLYGHHHNGYEREHWLDVLWVCGSCHHAEHGRGPKTRRV